MVGGTSAGTPQWAALLAIANQQRTASGMSALSGAVAALYQLPLTDFHDVTVGFNGFRAGPGYDLVTGRGTPIANRIVLGLDSPSAGRRHALARPVESDLAVSALAKLRTTRAVVDLIVWDMAENSQRQANDSRLAVPPSEAMLAMSSEPS